jgi:oligopeptidase B
MDGIRIPVSVAHAKDLCFDGRAPALMLVYGAYGTPKMTSFSAYHIPLLERGVVLALAHVRGGGELGQTWHDQGRLVSKRNSANDLVACIKCLIESGYCSAERLIIEGHSAGGLPVGIVLNEHPDLVGAAILRNPFVDVIGSMSNESNHLTVAEYEEWGNPSIASHFAAMREYCPYTNISPHDYPVVLARTSLLDRQVPPATVAKYVARLRALRTNDKTLLLKTDFVVGHAGPSARYGRLHDVAWDLAFMFSHWGIR